MSRTAVIIPNYNGGTRIGPCLRSLMPQCAEDTQVWVVDNGSTDGSDKAAEAFQNVRVLRLAENTGFTGAVNAGLEKVKDTEYVILLNNDTVVGKSFLKEMIAAMDRHLDAFSAQARLRRMDAPKRLDDGGDMYSAIGWAYGRGHLRPARKYSTEEEIFSACGAAAIYRTRLIREIGGFDPSIFAYLEDVDLGWRARRAGWKNYYIPSANVLHEGSATTGSRINAFKISYSSRHNVYLLRKNMPVRYRIAFLPLLAGGFLAKSIYFCILGYGKEYAQGLQSGFRMPLPRSVKAGEYRENDRKIAWEIFRNTPGCILDILGMHLIMHKLKKKS